jgi:hypothetical protein
MFKDMPKELFFVALILMAIGAWLCSSDDPLFGKKRRVSDCEEKNE